MVSARRFGRLGNELYQYACVIGYAIKHDLEWSFPKTSNDPIWNPTNFKHLYNPKWQEGREDILINENGHQYQEIPFKEEWRNLQIVLNGYYQSYKYFDFCKDDVLKVFNFPYEFKKGIVGLHVRRGDYLLYPDKHPVVNDTYLWQATMQLVDKGFEHFFVFSDDIKWCKDYFSQPRYQIYHKFEFSEHKSAIDDLTLMSWCEHQICSNSTMATWASELNKNPDKIVIVPSKDNWFGEGNKHLCVDDMYRPEWVQIKY